MVNLNGKGGKEMRILCLVVIAIGVAALFLIIGMPYLEGLRSDGFVAVSGIVKTVGVVTVSGDFLSSGKVLTIVTFKDGRVITFRGAIREIHLNRCNEFRKSRLTRSITARLCKDGG